MPAYYSILFSIITLFFMSACGGPATSRVELSSNLSFLTADHEVIFLGKHYLSNTKFSVIADTDGFDVDLLLGKWELAIVAWEKDGTGRFTGSTKCAVREDVDISGSAVKLDFNISISGCNSDYFRRPDYLASGDGQLQSVKIKACTSLESVTDGTSSCISPVTFSHFRLAYTPHSNGIKTNAQAPQFISDCHAFNTTTGLKFPAHAKVYLSFELITYSEATCATEVSRFNLPMGIAEHPGRTRVFDLGDQSIVFLGNGTPAIIANNTVQLSLGTTIPNIGVRNSTLTFKKNSPIHYTGSDAVNCTAVSTPAFTTVTSCTCALSVCTLSFTVNNTSGAGIDKIIFQYNLTDSSANTSNTATAVSCSGSNGSCTL